MFCLLTTANLLLPTPVCSLEVPYAFVTPCHTNQLKRKTRAIIHIIQAGNISLEINLKRKLY